jgi:hypothetical protein
MANFFFKHFTFTRHVYKPLKTPAGDPDDATEDGSESFVGSPFSCQQRRSENSPTTPSFSSLALLLLSLVALFVSSSFYLQAQRYRVTDDRCLRRMSAPSKSLPVLCHRAVCHIANPFAGPALEAVSFEWTSFYDDFQPDIYSGYPSETSEQAWGKLWDCKWRMHCAHSEQNTS